MARINGNTRSLLLAILGIYGVAELDAHAQISVITTTDKSSYVVGEPVEVTITAVNPYPLPVTLSFPSTLQAQYILDDSYINQQFGFWIFTEAVIPANGTYDWKYYHDWDYHPLSIGFHEVFGRIVDYVGLESAPTTFEVLTPEPVVEDIFIDFENIPNGNQIGGIWRTAYSQWGVELFSHGGDLSLREDHEENTVLYTPSGAHPFNIAAEFSMDVFHISADVGTSAGRTITMSAFDANGNVLGTATSDPIADYPNLVGPLAFSSSTPISSVKWVSSSPISTVMIDNLRLRVTAVPEPDTLALIIAAMLFPSCIRMLRRK